MEHVTFKHKRTTLERADKFISSHHFTDINLRSRLYPEKQPLVSIQHYATPDRIPYSQAISQTFKDTQVGHSFGPTWSTHWFKVELEIPKSWHGQEVHLLWNSDSEALVWIDGDAIQGLSGENERISFPLREVGDGKSSHSSNGRQIVYIEMACNGLCGCGLNGLINPPELKKCFQLKQAEVAVFDRQVYKLLLDVEILHDMAKEMTEDTERGYQALYTVNRMINECTVGDSSSYQRAQKIADEFFAQRNGDSQHTIYAMGHSHIDTAWLWPYAETIRKCARSWSCTLRLLEKYPSMTFTCSQAQQYEWVKQHYPSIYKDIQKFVKSGQFIPVGGTWVEMDGNIPSGEAFVRQFLLGQRYFQQEFGLKCKEFWLPDTFGYSAQLPQIMRSCGINRFLTQKMSWNIYNKFPHHTFWWSGIDGSRVLSHFPPGDTYHMMVKVKELLYTLKNFRDKGRSSRSVYLYGYGDGGNGPTEEMVNKLERMENVDGLPKVKMSSPDEFFSNIEQKEEKNLCTWSGELYLEMHNGTYTTHAEVKKQNRKGELLLRDVEFLATIATVLSGTSGSGYKYPSGDLDRLWKLLLLNQFHDVLPGSSIGIVYTDAHEYYRDIQKTGNQLLDKSLAAIAQKGDNSVVVNTLGWNRREVISLTKGDKSPSRKKIKTGESSQQVDHKGDDLVYCEVPSFGISEIPQVDIPAPVTVNQTESGIQLSNGLLSAVLDNNGRIISLCNTSSPQVNLINADYPGNQLLIYDDIPLYWDAWDVMDYHLETRKLVDNVTQKAVILDKGPLRVTIQVCLRISEVSHIKQEITLDAGSPYITFKTQVSWHENRKFLKVEFPTSIHSNKVSFDIQYGFIERPNHYNTSWDSARFEVCGHKWADISDYNQGLAVLNDCKYGYSAIDGILRLSLLRSPKAPDADADMGDHEFTYAVMPHQGCLQESGVIQQACNINSPLIIKSGNNLTTCSSYFTVNTTQVILDTVKLSEDSGNKMVLRLYETYGGSTTAEISTIFKNITVQRCNCLEEVIPDERFLNVTSVGDQQTQITIEFKPFELISLLITF
ncbi:hypothetical protein SNE40_005515 [Patella caerulea]|uniref:alpha-mannosidase n=1 Tax=Patella caerulea TaxID=87958 RepID=A0AAN8K375_PATCE